MRFAGKVAIVTGSSSGIGAATARLLATEGAAVVVSSSSTVAAGEAVVAEIAGTGGTATYVRADVTDADEREQLVARAVERFGRLDVLVNNAGTTQVIAHHDLDTASADVFRRIFEVNVIGTYEMIRLSLPHLRANGDGAVVNVTSLAGVRPTGSSVPYAVSKAAGNHLTALLANVSGPEVRINAVAPGLVRTPWTAGWGPVHDSMATRSPLGRSAEPEDIAVAIADTAASPYLTGQVIVVDGGLGLR